MLLLKGKTFKKSLYREARVRGFLGMCAKLNAILAERVAPFHWT